MCRSVFNLQKLPLGSANMVAKKEERTKEKREKMAGRYSETTSRCHFQSNKVHHGGLSCSGEIQPVISGCSSHGSGGACGKA
jgi:hypothetical protein